MNTIQPAAELPEEYLRARLREVLKTLLPEQGTVALYLEHATKAAYFPIVWQPAMESEVPYYLLPFTFDSLNDPNELIEPVDSVELEKWAKRLRFESATGLYAAGKVFQSVTPIDGSGKRPELLLVRSSPTTMPTQLHADVWHAELVQAIKDTWVKLHTNSLQFERGINVSMFCERVAAVVNDTRETPPYFPILFYEFTAKAGASEARCHGINYLSVNCLLFEQQAAPWILEAPKRFLDSAVCQWTEDLAQREDLARLPQGVQLLAQHTEDHVAVVARLLVGEAGWLIVARHNRPRGQGGALRTNPQVPVLSRAADVLAMVYSYRAAESDALLSLWAVREDAGKAVQLGVRAGAAQVELSLNGQNNVRVLGEHHEVTLKVLFPSSVTESEELNRFFDVVVEAHSRVDQQLTEQVILDQMKELQREIVCGYWYGDVRGLFPAGPRHDPTGADFGKIGTKVGSEMLAFLRRFHAGYSEDCAEEVGKCWQLRAMHSLRDGYMPCCIMAIIAAGDAFEPGKNESLWDAFLLWPNKYLGIEVEAGAKLLWALQEIRHSKCCATGFSVRRIAEGGKFKQQYEQELAWEIVILWRMKNVPQKDATGLLTAALIDPEAERILHGRQFTAACLALRQLGAVVRVGFVEGECAEGEWIIEVAIPCVGVCEP